MHGLATHWVLFLIVAVVLYIVAIICQVRNMKNVLQFKANWALIAFTFISGALGSLSR